MASFMKVRDNEGNIIDVPVLKGNTGEAGKITEVTATIDDTSGNPSVAVTTGGTPEERTINFAFSGLVGSSETKISYGNTDLEAGVSELAEGEVYIFYE